MTEKALRALAKKDKVLARIIKRSGPMVLEKSPHRTPFQSLFRSIVYQQLTGKAAATILGRVLALYRGKKFPRPEDVLKTKDEKFRAAGLSGAKTRAIKDLAQKTLDGTVPKSSAKFKKMSNEEIIEALTQVRGVGPWTVEMYLIFTLRREDVLPLTDFGVRKGFGLAYGHAEMPAIAVLEAWGREYWAPHRSTAAWYMWRYLDSLKMRAKKR